MNNKLKQYRAIHNMTQQDLADKVQVRRETIVFMESGKYVPSLKLAMQIAQFFKVPVEELFSLE